MAMVCLAHNTRLMGCMSEHVRGHMEKRCQNNDSLADYILPGAKPLFYRLSKLEPLAPFNHQLAVLHQKNIYLAHLPLVLTKQAISWHF